VLWAIASSAFVIYLYRKLNAVPAEVAAPDNAIDIELDNINSRIDALEAMGKTRRMAP
jgi:hypothetical protein